MPLTKETVIDQTTVLEDGVILYRKASRIVEDGVVIAETYHRTSLVPGETLTTHPSSVAAVANAVWTPAVVQAYRAKIGQSNRS